MELDLFPELEIALESVVTDGSLLHGLENGASWFVGVGAIRKATVCGVLVDIGERVVQPVARPKKAQLAHPRRVDQHGTTVQHQQLASGSGMDTLSRPADRACVKCVTATQSVDERGLSDSRGAQQAIGSPGDEKRTQLVQAETRDVAERHDLVERAPAPNLPERMTEFLGRHEVGLRQEYPRLNRALVGHHQVSVEPRQVEIVATSLHDEGDIDVRRDHLGIHGLAGALAAQERLPWQDVMNHGGAARGMALHTYPVAHARQIGGGGNGETELAREFRGCLGILTPDEKGAPVDGRDARDAVSRLQDGGGTLLKPVVKS